MKSEIKYIDKPLRPKPKRHVDMTVIRDDDAENEWTQFQKITAGKSLAELFRVSTEKLHES
jgi:hypothetical protein